MASGNIILAVAGGGALGALARYGVSSLAIKTLGPSFPWGTLTVNALGSLLMGLAITWLAAHEPQSPVWRAFLTVGVLGAFTTFSTFSLDAVTLYKDRTIAIAGLYVGASLVLSIGSLLLGLMLGKAAT